MALRAFLGVCLFPNINSAAPDGAHLRLDLEENYELLGSLRDPTVLIEAEVDAGNIPGLSVSVTVADDVVYTGAFGSAFPEDGAEAFRTTSETAFTFASISKTITGVAVLMLHERGLVDLEADINEYLSYVVAVPGITLAQLMTHTSSITDNYYFTIPKDELYVDGDPLISLEAFNIDMFTVDGKWFSERTFVGEPGGRFDYSNVGSSLAACVVEHVVRAHGLATDYNDFVRNSIMVPLGVGGSHYLRDFDGMMEPPVGARPSEFWRGEMESWPHYSVPDLPNGFWRARSLDYARVLGMVANGGVWQGVRILSSDSIATILTRTEWDGGRQGAAFWSFRGGANSPLIGHSGGELGIATDSVLDLETGVSVTLLSNGDWGQGNSFSGAMQRIEDLLLLEYGGSGAAAREGRSHVNETIDVVRYLRRRQARVRALDGGH